MDKREWMLHAALAIPQRDEDGLTGHVARLGALYDAICAATPTVADEGWVEHDGDVNKAPVEGRVVEWLTSDGSKGTNLSEDLSWDFVGEGYDIVGWRYV